MNAKERRLARRKAARAEGISNIKQPAANEVTEPCHGNHQQENPTLESDGNSSSVQLTISNIDSRDNSACEDRPMNAKQRRLARRKAERGGHGEQLQPEKRAGKKMSNIMQNIDKEEQKTDVDTTKMNAKQRRLAKRQAERESLSTSPGRTNLQQQGVGGNKLTERTDKKKNAKKTKKIPNIVFVGQLDFKTTSKQIEDHFRAHDIHGFIKVRLLTDKVTKKPKGMAFVEVSNPTEMYKCLKLHHSSLNRRRINVEKSCGGKNTDKRKEKINELKQKQRQAVETTVKRILKEFTDRGDISETEFNETLMERLVSYEGTIVEEALKKYVDEDKEKVQNRTALLVSLVRDLDNEKAKEREEKLKKEAANKKAAEVFGAIAQKRKMQASDGSGQEDALDEESGGNPISRKKKKTEISGQKDGKTKFNKNNKLPKDEAVNTLGAGGISESAKRAAEFASSRDFSKLFPSMKGRGGGRAGKFPGRGGGGRGLLSVK